MIQNYSEILNVLDRLFSSTAIYDVEEALAVLNKTKQTRKEHISRISLEIRKLNLLIEKYKYQIREAVVLAEKKEKGIKLNESLNLRRQLIKEYNEQRQASSFFKLHDEAKEFSCCHNLFKKYLTEELLKDYGLSDGNTHSVDVTAFKNSRLFQEFMHIKDYVASYIENYPERVKGGRFFVGLHKNERTLADLRTAVDAYFAKLNSASEKELNNIKKSHDGFEIVATYPKNGLQAVKLTTKRALNYEGSAMHHCVGSYAEKVEKGQTEIYSLRDIGKEGQELTPHATIEFRDGKVAQIKGPHDKAVQYPYVFATRKLLIKLLKAHNFDEVMHNKDIPLAEKNNIGVHASNGKLYDIFHLSETVAFDKICIDGEYLHAVPLAKMKIDMLEISGHIREQDISDIALCQNIKQFKINDIIFEGQVFDLSGINLEKLDIVIKEAPQLKTFVCPKDIKHLALSGKMPLLSELQHAQNLETLTLNGHFDSLESLDLSAFHNLQGLDLMMSDFPKLKTLKLPEGLKTFLSDASKFNALEEIDFSKCNKTCFGKALYENPERYEIKKLFKHMKSDCFSMSLTQMPKLKRFIFPNKIQQINLAQTCFDDSKAFDFSNCGQLQVLNLIFTNFPDNAGFNLEKCLQLQELICSYDTLLQSELPHNVERLNVYGSDTHTVQPIPLSYCSKLKRLSCHGFCPQLESIPQSVKEVFISRATIHLDKQKTLDLSSYDVFDIDFQNTSTFKALTKISFPKQFSSFALSLSQAPHLEELDFSHMTDNFRIGTLRFIKHDMKKWFLADDDLFKKIQKISLSAEIIPTIEPELTHLSHLVFQLHPKATQKYVEQFQKLYPHAKLIQSPQSKTALGIKPAVPYLPPVVYQSHHPLGGYLDFSL